MTSQSSTVFVGCNLYYQVEKTTSFLLHISTAQSQFQTVTTEQMICSSPNPLEYCQVGPLGNRLQRLVADPGELRISYEGTLELNAEIIDSDDVTEARYKNIPADVLPYLNPSRYCESDKLYRFAAEEFGNLTPGYSRVSAICDWVNSKLAYTPGSTGPTTTACDVLLQRTGVCRDYAHVGISLCRALGIPARYVSGYAVDLEPPDFHGFFEAFLDDRWFLFDATKLAPVGGFVRIGTGRDAADVAFATLIGEANMTGKNVWATNSDPTDKDASQSSKDVGFSSAE